MTVSDHCVMVVGPIPRPLLPAMPLHPTPSFTLTPFSLFLRSSC